MNCTNIQFTPNKRQVFHDGLDPLLQSYPCGCCYNCRENYKNEWAIRTFFEIKEAKKEGFAMQLVLTYRNSDLPMYSDVLPDGLDIEGNPKYFHFNQAVFNHKHVKTFIKSIYKKCTRVGFPTMRYLVAEEFGSDDNHTHRPHYHVLLLFPKMPYTPLCPKDDYYKVILRWCRSLWKYGFTFPRLTEDSRSKIDDRGFHKYISKYLVKDMDFYNEDFKKYLDILYSMRDNGEDVSSKIDYLESVSPCHMQSMSFGAAYLDELSKYEQLPDSALDEFVKVHLPFDTFQYKVPRYYINKMCYYYECTGRKNELGNDILVRHLTDFGKKYKRYQLRSLIKKENDRINKLVYHQEISKYISDDWVKSDERCSRLFLHNVNDVCDYLKSKISNTLDLSCYRVLYRYVVVPHLDTLFDVHSIDHFITRNIFSYEDMPKMRQIYNGSWFVTSRLDPVDAVYKLRETCSYVFTDFELFYNLLDYIVSVSSSKQSAVAEKEQKSVDDLRNKYYRPLNYVP